MQPHDSDAQARDRIVQLAALAHIERVAWGDGQQVCWRGFGSGSPLVLVHGGHGSWLHWVRNIEALARLHTVWVVDLPGYGDSDPPPGGDLAALLAPTLSTLATLIGRDTPMGLVGFSFGGLVAAHMAAQLNATGRPPRVSRLALLGTGGHQGPRRPRGELIAWKPAWRAHDAAALEQAMRHNLAMHMLSVAAQEVDPLALRVHTEACVRTRFRSKEISRAGGLLEVLAPHAVPTLLAWGEHDVTAEPVSLAPTLAAALPQGQSCVVPGAGHWVQYERADAVNPLLLDWFAELRAGAAKRPPARPG